MAGIGLAVCVAFSIALRAGTHYLQARKESVRLLEKELGSFGAMDVIGASPSDTGNPANLLMRSPTVLVLQITPLAILAGWLVVLVLTVFLPGRYVSS